MGRTQGANIIHTFRRAHRLNRPQKMAVLYTSIPFIYKKYLQAFEI